MFHNLSKQNWFVQDPIILSALKQTPNRLLSLDSCTNLVMVQGFFWNQNESGLIVVKGIEIKRVNILVPRKEPAFIIWNENIVIIIRMPLVFIVA